MILSASLVVRFLLITVLTELLIDDSALVRYWVSNKESELC